MNRFLSVPSIYVYLWCIYFMQGALFPETNNYAQMLLVVLILMSVYCYYSLFYKNTTKPLYIKWVNILFWFFITYGVGYLISGKVSVISRSGTVVQSFALIKQMMISYLPLFTIYYYSRKHKVSESDMRWWAILFLLTAIVWYYVERMKALQIAEALNMTRTEFTNNSAYQFVAIIPLLIAWKKKPYVQYLLFGVCMVFIIISMKRGAVVCGGIISFMFLRQTQVAVGKKMGYKTIILFAIVFFALYYLISYMMAQSELFVERINETIAGNTSGRDRIAEDLINHLLNQGSFISVLFGEGANATLKYAENYAHNDWLEIAVCEGIVGLIVYMLYWRAFYINVRSFRDNKTAYFVCHSYLILFFVSSFFSQSFNEISLFASVPLGYYLFSAEQSQNSHKNISIKI